MIRITSHVDGFRRCGVAHPAKAKDYADDVFTEKQLKELKAEPKLHVEVLEDKPETKPKDTKSKTKAKD